MLKKIKLRLDITDDIDPNAEEILLDLIDDVTSEVLLLLNRDQLPLAAENIVKELVVIKWNRRKSEGITSESMGGISQSFEADIPANIKRQIRKLRKL